MGKPSKYNFALNSIFTIWHLALSTLECTTTQYYSTNGDDDDDDDDVPYCCSHANVTKNSQK